MPRVGKSVAKGGQDGATSVLGPPPTFVPFHPTPELAKQREISRQETIAGLERSAKRVRHPKGGLRRARFLVEVDVLRMQGYGPSETAEILGCSRQQVNRALMTVRANADFTSQLQRLDEIGMPLTVDNVLNQLRDGDKETTFRMMDGRGMWRTHKSIEAQVTKRKLEMKISVVMPDHYLMSQVPPPRPGSIVGAPMTIDVPAAPQPAELVPAAPVPVPVVAGPPDLT